MGFKFWPFRSNRKQREEEAQAADAKRSREEIEARRREFRARLMQPSPSSDDGMAYRNAGLYPPYSPVVHSDSPCHSADSSSSASSDSGSGD